LFWSRFKALIECLALGFPLAASTVFAQTSTGPKPEKVSRTFVLGVNAGVGALTAALGAAFGGYSVWNALAKGTMGGAAVYYGKVIVANDDPSTIFLGRQIASVGASMIQNSARGKNMLDRIALPWGPLRLYLQPAASKKLRVKLDLATSIVAIEAFRDKQLTFDFKTSAYTGAGVFRVDSAAAGVIVGGSHMADVIKIRADTPYISTTSGSVRRMIGHELVHVSQYDITFIAWAEPVEARLVPLLPGGTWLNRYVDLGINLPALSLLNSVIPYAKRPWEREAVTLERP
jgi:hypothetical protein